MGAAYYVGAGIAVLFLIVGWKLRPTIMERRARKLKAKNEAEAKKKRAEESAIIRPLLPRIYPLLSHNEPRDVFHIIENLIGADAANWLKGNRDTELARSGFTSSSRGEAGISIDDIQLAIKYAVNSHKLRKDFRGLVLGASVQLDPEKIT